MHTPSSIPSLLFKYSKLFLACHDTTQNKGPQIQSNCGKRDEKRMCWKLTRSFSKGGGMLSSSLPLFYYQRHHCD